MNRAAGTPTDQAVLATTGLCSRDKVKETE